MKFFMVLVLFFAFASIICFANTQQAKTGSKPNKNLSKSNGYASTSSAAKRQEDAAGGESEVRTEIKNSVPSKKLTVKKKTETIDIKGEELGDNSPSTESNNDISTLLPVERQEAPPNEYGTTPESKNTVPSVKKEKDSKRYIGTQQKKQDELKEESTGAPNVIFNGAGLAGSDPTARPEDDKTAQAGDLSEGTSHYENKTFDMEQNVQKTYETLYTEKKLEDPNEFLFQTTSPKITNESDSSEGIKREFTQEQITPTPLFCPKIWPECSSDQFDRTVSEVSKDLMTFTLHLFQRLSAKDFRPNLVVAPISVALALSNIMLGSGGETRQDMLKILYKKTEATDCIHEAIKNLTSHDSIISASNFFYRKDLIINDEFKEQSERFYGAKGMPLGSDNKKNLNKINSWVSKKTKQLIPTLLEELPFNLQMILVNVIYYQGMWLSKFDPSNTKKETFHPPSSSPVKVPMMNGHKYPLQNTNDQYLQAQVARFPLSDNCSLLIFLPQSHGPDALKKMTKKLNQEVVNTLMTQLEDRPIKATSVSLPRLKLDTNFHLNEALGLLGLYNLFEQPNLCALSSNTELGVSDIHHRAVLEVKEEGVKAAAATSVTIARTVSVFDVRRPFLFIMVSDKSRVPILIGQVTDPSQ